jgi:hypothetical protein
MTISLESLVGKRIRLVQMFEDPNPIEPGQCGLVTYAGGDVLSVKWDNGRSLGVVVGVDEFEII